MIPVGYRHYKTLIDAAAIKHGLDPLLVAALVWQESAFNTDGFRHEPAFWNRYLKGNPKYKHLNPRRVSSSYGLMQCLYCRLLEDKIADNDAWPPETLFVPEVGMDIGCAFFGELLNWARKGWPDRTDTELTLSALASYNGGRGSNTPDNKPLRNGKYAKEVWSKYEYLKTQGS